VKACCEVASLAVRKLHLVYHDEIDVGNGALDVGLYHNEIDLVHYTDLALDPLDDISSRIAIFSFKGHLLGPVGG
jgi:hypothetical protein